ncbi:hypothetical protein L7F22_029848 [Adiantum nelumboides]|nr:hypothetical protein [Adiantum nelumboides]
MTRAAGQDEPPELEDMSDYVANMCQRKNIPATVTSKRTTDSTTLNQVCPEARPADMFNTLKKGFIDSSYEKKRGQKGKKHEMLFLKGGKQAHHSKVKDIPDILKVKPEDSPRDRARKELISMLEPTKEIVQDVMENEIIKSGLEDPDVMAAVQEIAGDADSIQKYRSNPKVVSFYSQLGKLMGDKIQQQGKIRSKPGCST